MKAHGDEAALFVLIVVISTFCLSRERCKSPSQEQERNEMFVSLQQFAVPLALAADC